MRGAHVAALQHSQINRFIPAHAGSTRRLQWRVVSRAVHPRACGEHTASRIDVAYCGGSSPRMRGARVHSDEALARVRFIPAHAGSTGIARVRRHAGTVHPRACGEHCSTCPSIPEPSGSSPRMRGAPIPKSCILSPARFIPAHAGSTPFVIPCGPWCYRPCKSVPILRGKINTTLHLPLARRIQGAGRPDLQVSCDSCQRFQIRNPHHWGKSRR